jgi:type II secretory pathway component PulM
VRLLWVVLSGWVLLRARRRREERVLREWQTKRAMQAALDRAAEDIAAAYGMSDEVARENLRRAIEASDPVRFRTLKKWGIRP